MVALNVWPTDAADGSVANEARWRKMGRHFTPTGVLPIGGVMAPTLAFPNLTVKNGAAWVDGHFCELLSDQVLTATANGIAVVRFDPAANTAELLWRDGVSTPAQSPTGTFEMLVASTVGSALVDQRAIIDPATNNRLLGLAEATANQGSIGSSLVDLTGLTLTLTVPPNRILRVDGDLEMSSSAAPCTGSMRIVLDGSGAKVGETYMHTSGFAYSVRVLRVFRNLAAGSHTFKLMGSVSGGTGSVIASATNPAQIAVTDLGSTV